MAIYTLMNITNDYDLEDVFLLLTMHINYYYDEIYFNKSIMQFFEDSGPLLIKIIKENPYLTQRQLGSAFLAFNILMIISLS